MHGYHAPSSNRHSKLELASDVDPNGVLSELVAGGARLVSLNPLRATLEDFFVERVTTAGDAAGRQL